MTWLFAWFRRDAGLCRDRFPARPGWAICRLYPGVTAEQNARIADVPCGARRSLRDPEMMKWRQNFTTLSPLRRRKALGAVVAPRARSFASSGFFYRIVGQFFYVALI